MTFANDLLKSYRPRHMAFLLALLAGLVLYLRPGWGGWPLLPVALYWLHQLRQGKPVFQRTGLEIWLLLFGVTAVIGLLTAFDFDHAWQKLWVLIDAIFIFYALVRQSRRDAWRIACYLSLVSVPIIGYFLLTHNWHTMPADIALLDRGGKWFMGFRPNLPVRTLTANSAAGLLIMLYPLQVALTHYGRKIHRAYYVQVGFLTGTLTLIGLFLTSSRAAWLALGLALALWGVQLWFVSLAGRLRWVALTTLVVGTAVIASILLITQQETIAAQLDSLTITRNRLDLIAATARLGGDYPITGAGLAAFGGHYSHYIAVLPFFVFNYGHSLWPDVWLEQGAIGALSLLLIFCLSLLRLFAARRENKLDIGEETDNGYEPYLGLFRGALTTSFVAVLLHGMLDDALYGYMGSPLLLLLPGLTLMITTQRGQKPRPLVPLTQRQRRLAWLAAAVVVVGVLGWQQRPLRAMWLANSGAVAMARMELNDWPSGRWDDGRYLSQLRPLVPQFETAVALNPAQRTAHHRLGLIAMSAHEFDTAVQHLEAAHAIDPGHRGITKALGYAYVWNGQLDAAQQTLAAIPESQQEMQNYVSWWQSHNREHLAELASQMAQRLQN